MQYLENCYERDNLSRDAKHTNNPDINFEVKRARNRLESSKRELKRNYFRTAINDAQGGSSKVWKVLKKFLHNTKSCDEIPTINGKGSPQGIVQELNKFFGEIGVNLGQQMPDSELELNNEKSPDIREFDLSPCTVDEGRSFYSKSQTPKQLAMMYFQ